MRPPPGQLSPLLINYTHRVLDWWSFSVHLHSGPLLVGLRVERRGSLVVIGPREREGEREGDDYLTSGGASVFDHGYR